MVAQLPDNSWSKLLTFVLSSKQECAEYGIRSDHRRYESVPTIASNAAHLVFSFSRRSVSSPSVTSLPLEWLRPILPATSYYPFDVSIVRRYHAKPSSMDVAVKKPRVRWT